MRVRFPLPAPRIFTVAKAGAENSLSRRREIMPDKQRLGVRRSWRAGADCKSVGLSLSWFESSHSHQNKNTRASGVFVLVKCGIGFESCNHLIAGLTMKLLCDAVRVAHNIRMPRSPTPPAWARESATPTKIKPPTNVGGFVFLTL